MQSNFVDGMTIVDNRGNTAEVFAPRWWRVDRWLRLWLQPRRLRATITMTTVDGEVFDVRVIWKGPMQ